MAFDIGKIAGALKKAFEATEQNHTDNVIDFLALKVTDFNHKVKDGGLISVEDIQDSAETVLSKPATPTRRGVHPVPQAAGKLRQMKSTYLDYRDTVNSYVDATDWRVKENSTVTYSVAG